MAMSAEEYRALVAAQPKRLKFQNKPTTVDDIRFDSKGEARRWGELQLLARAGEIQNLQRQVTFDLSVAGMHVCSYVADFVYDEKGTRVVEDFKCRATKTALYRVKKRLMLAIHGIQIREVM